MVGNILQKVFARSAGEKTAPPPPNRPFTGALDGRLAPRKKADLEFGPQPNSTGQNDGESERGPFSLAPPTLAARLRRSAKAVCGTLELCAPFRAGRQPVFGHGTAFWHKPIRFFALSPQEEGEESREGKKTPGNSSTIGKSEGKPVPELGSVAKNGRFRRTPRRTTHRTPSATRPSKLGAATAGEMPR